MSSRQVMYDKELGIVCAGQVRRFHSEDAKPRAAPGRVAAPQRQSAFAPNWRIRWRIVLTNRNKRAQIFNDETTLFAANLVWNGVFFQLTNLAGISFLAQETPEVQKLTEKASGRQEGGSRVLV